jgi:hypothetical protein
MRSVGESRGSAQRREFLHAVRVARVALGFSCLLVACEGEVPIPSYDYQTPRSCLGAYTPRSEICWDSSDGGDEGQITANRAAAEENNDRLHGDRCLDGIVGAPGVEGTLTVSFGTVRLGGMYAPANCGAVWIEDSFGKYIRTLEVWAGLRQPSVVAWSSGVCQKDLTITAPDVITSATLDGPAAHTSKWDTKDWRGRVVPDGVYSLWMQVTENEIAPEGPFMKIDFPKDAIPHLITPLATRGFKEIMLAYSPMPAAAPPATAP